MTLWLEDLNESYNTLNSPGGSSVRCAFMIPNFCLVLSISEPTSSIKFLKLHDYHLSCKYIYMYVQYMWMMIWDINVYSKRYTLHIHLKKLYCKHACNLNIEVIYTNIVHVQCICIKNIRYQHINKHDQITWTCAISYHGNNTKSTLFILDLSNHMQKCQC